MVSERDARALRRRRSLIEHAAPELPFGWQEWCDENNTVYYMDHHARRTYWEHPRAQREREQLREVAGAIAQTRGTIAVRLRRWQCAARGAVRRHGSLANDGQRWRRRRRRRQIREQALRRGVATAPLAADATRLLAVVADLQALVASIGEPSCVPHPNDSQTVRALRAELHLRRRQRSCLLADLERLRARATGEPAAAEWCGSEKQQQQQQRRGSAPDAALQGIHVRGTLVELRLELVLLRRAQEASQRDLARLADFKERAERAECAANEQRRRDGVRVDVPGWLRDRAWLDDPDSMRWYTSPDQLSFRCGGGGGSAAAGGVYQYAARSARSCNVS